MPTDDLFLYGHVQVERFGQQRYKRIILLKRTSVGNKSRGMYQKL